MRREAARARRRVADIYRFLGQHAQAKQEYIRAIASAEQIIADFPSDSEQRRRLASAHTALGEMLIHDGDRTEAEDHLGKARDLLTALVAEYPAEGTYQSDLAAVYLVLGNLDHDLGENLGHAVEPATVVRNYRKVIDIMTPLVAQHPGVPRYRQLLGGGHCNLGEALARQGDRAAAGKHLDRAVELAAALVAEYPGVRGYRFTLASFYRTSASVREREAGPEVWHQFIKALAPLVTEYPGVAQYRGDLASGYLRLGNALTENPDRAAAYRQAIDLGAVAVKECPEVVWYGQNLAESHAALGEVLWDGGGVAEATEQFRKALSVHEQLGARFPGPAQWDKFAWFLATCSETRLRESDRAVEFAQKATKAAPEMFTYWGTLGVAHYRAGDWRAAADALERSMRMNQGGDACDWLFLAMARCQLGDKEQARRWYEQAVRAAKENKPLSNCDPGELRRFRTEAEQLMKREDPAKRK